MTIGQMISKQTDDFDSVNINYTDENGIPWHIQLPFEKAKNCDAIMQCGYQTFKKSYCGRKIIGIFDVVSNNLPEDATQKSDFIFPKTSEPARKYNPESDEITVQDYINALNDIKKLSFSLETIVGYWDTNTINIQDLSVSMSSLENLLVNDVKLSAIDESVLKIYLLTRELESWKEQQKQKREQQQRKIQENREQEEEDQHSIRLFAGSFVLGMIPVTCYAEHLKDVGKDIGITTIIGLALGTCVLIFFASVILCALYVFITPAKKKMRKQEMEEGIENLTLFIFFSALSISEFVGVGVSEYLKRCSIGGILPFLGLLFGVVFSAILLFIVFCMLYEYEPGTTVKKVSINKKRIIDPRIWIVVAVEVIAGCCTAVYNSKLDASPVLVCALMFGGLLSLFLCGFVFGDE